MKVMCPNCDERLFKIEVERYKDRHKVVILCECGYSISYIVQGKQIVRKERNSVKENRKRKVGK